MANLSAGLRLSDLDDFISPSQACILPVNSANFSGKETEKDGGGMSSAIRLDDSTGNAYQVLLDGTEEKLAPATISLTDCLACSGCITSAESVLVSAQSHQELLNQLSANQIATGDNRPEEVKRICISLSRQTVASIAAKYRLTFMQSYRKLHWFLLQHLKCDHVFDIAFSRDFALLESAREFCRRYRSSTSTTDTTTLPVLTSACPGWICYAEKTHSYVLPLIDSTKSPQQIMGSLVKDYLANSLSIPSNRMYHVTVMPCFDKKLEASRSDFYNDVYKTRDVDLVITTGELESLIGEQGFTRNVLDLPESSCIDDVFIKSDESGELLGTEGSTSGGYMSYVMRYASSTLFGHQLSPQDITSGRNGIMITPGRNGDYTEYALHLQGHEAPLLRFVTAYGFRNIQNLVRKFKANLGTAARGARASTKSASSHFHYIEIMACPSGCTNGGGQLRAGKGESVTSTDLIKQVDTEYHSTSKSCVQYPDQNPLVIQLYRDWLGIVPGTETNVTDVAERSRVLLHTCYHAPTKNLANPILSKW